MKSKKTFTRILFTLLIAVVAPLTCARAQQLSGEKRVWRAITLTFDGPQAAETAARNPFRDYRLIVTFTQGDRHYVAPGYFAADGKAAETGAIHGKKWRVHFMPDRAGKWQYKLSFRHGHDVAISDDPNSGKALAPDGASGEFAVAPAKKDGKDLQDRGRLRYVGKRYLQYAGSGEYYLKGGADSPENFLAYVGFDDTYKTNAKRKKKRGKLHRYLPHVRDWRNGDPTWKGGKGKGIVGALNYLASKGMNSVYFLTMNVTGDGNDVWPWINPNVRDRFDCSKLDQWNIVFDHMDRRGIVLHVVTQETENDQLLDGGKLGPLRKLYYRELIARFSHHHGVLWNLGEENTNTIAQRKAFCDFFKRHDPYQNAILVHTFPGKKEQVYAPLLGYPKFDGPSLQFSDDWNRIPLVVGNWVVRSGKAGRPWVVFVDEPGTARFGLDPDSKKSNNNQALARKTALWGALMAGGAGVEWYFGYKNPHNDLNCEDWRSRERMWNQTRYALNFFHRHLPFDKMQPCDNLVTGKNAQCFAKPGEIYAVYLPYGGNTSLGLEKHKANFDVSWYDPRQGGALLKSKVTNVRGPGEVALGGPPRQPTLDWVVLVKRESTP